MGDRHDAAAIRLTLRPQGLLAPLDQPTSTPVGPGRRTLVLPGFHAQGWPPGREDPEPSLRGLRRRDRALAGSGQTGSYTEQAMSITVKLPGELAALLAEEAARQSLTPDELAAGVSVSSAMRVQSARERGSTTSSPLATDRYSAASAAGSSWRSSSQPVSASTSSVVISGPGCDSSRSRQASCAGSLRSAAASSTPMSTSRVSDRTLRRASPRLPPRCGRNWTRQSRRTRGAAGSGCARPVKNTKISAGSAKLPIQVVRLAPNPPSGLAVSNAASEIAKFAKLSTSATDQVREKTPTGAARW